MGETTGIAWTHHTFNPWEGCAKVSPGCKNCYAETRNARFHPRPDVDRLVAAVVNGVALSRGKHWGLTAPRLKRSESYWREPLKWARAAREAGERRRVFCASVADVFEGRWDLDAPRARLFALIEETPELDWLLLTKRPEKMHQLVPAGWRDRWPSHVWAGATAENQETLLERAEWLRIVPARVKFLSCEPLLEALDLDPPFCDMCGSFEGIGYEDGVPFCEHHEREVGRSALLSRHADEDNDGINWVIVGGESGKSARPYDVNWASNIIRQCREFGVPVFHKQVGSNWTDGFGPGPKLIDRAGADPSEWPHELQVQEVPR